MPRNKTVSKAMPIPDYQTFMLPLLTALQDGAPREMRVLYEQLSDHFELTADERQQLLPSGSTAIVRNRIGWARTYLKKAGLLDSPKRGMCQITARGSDVLASRPASLNTDYLGRFPEFVAFRTGPTSTQIETNELGGRPDDTDTTPTEAIELAYQRLRKQLAQELLDTVKQASPAFFERLVVDLMLQLGYGGSRREAGEATRLSADGGVDGVIREDRLGLDVVYLQAKRWEKTVGRPDIQQFAGALQGFRAKKGVFITTSTFSAEAWDYVSHIDSKIVLIDGERLAELMIDAGTGVSTRQRYDIKQLDSDYFSED